MDDRSDREDWKRERSLLALGQAMRGEDRNTPSVSLLSIAPLPGSAKRDRAVFRQEANSNRPSAASPAETDAKHEKPDAENSRRPGEHDDTGRQPLFDRLVPKWAKLKRSRDLLAKPDEIEALGAEQGKRLEAAPSAPLLLEPSSSRIQTAETDAGFEHHSADAPSDQWKPLIDPMMVIGGIGRSKTLIVAMTILGAAIGVSLALSTPKKYEASTELILDPRDLKLTERDLTQSVIASDATLALVENQMRVLTSGTVLNKVVDKLNLVNDPEFNGSGGSRSTLSLIRSLISGNDGPISVDKVRRRALAVSNLAERVSVDRSGKTFVITVSAITQDGEKSALIANTMTDVFLQTYGQIQSNTAGRATDELTARLDELRKSVETAERKVEDFRASHDLIDAQGRLISDDELLKLNEQLSVARARTLELNARAASARATSVDSVLGGTLPEEVNSNVMSDLRSQYATLKQESDRAAVRLGPRHPERRALDAQLAGARDRIAGELRRIASSLQVDLKRAVQLEQELSVRLTQLKVRSGDVNSDLVSLRELEREATAKRSVYEAYLLRSKETGEQRDINTANVNVISKAFPPLEPNGPSRAIVALAGLLFGFASGVGIGAMRGAYESLRATAGIRERKRKPKLDERPLRTDDSDERAPHRPSTSAHEQPITTEARRSPAEDSTAYRHSRDSHPLPTRINGSERNQPFVDEEASIDEIRASLREFRDAVRELSASRSRRRYF